MRLFASCAGLLLLACGIAVSAHGQDSSPPVVEGTLVGHAGTPLSTSHVHIHPYGANPASGEGPVRSISIGSDKSFRAALDTTGVVLLRFTGQNHEMQETTLFVEAGDTVGVDVQLGTFESQDSLDVKVSGPFNNFSSRKGTVPMTRQDDGTYAATVPSPNDSLTYSILGAPEEGTQFDTLVYANRGSYRPRIAAPGDSTTVVYDPDAVPRSDTEPTVEFRESTSTAAQYASFVKDVKSRRESFIDKISSADDREERTAISDTFDWSLNRERLDEALAGDRSPRVENAYRAAYLQNTVEHDSTISKEALSTIPPSSPLWAMARVGRVIQSAGGPEGYEPFAREVLRKNPSEDVRASTVLMLLFKAEKNGEEEKQKLLYAWMEGEYGDKRIAELARTRYAPDRSIQKNKPAPDFEVTALRDTTKTYTLSSFDGQYVLFDFWATWCGPCVQELPTLRAADSTYGGDNFAILSLSLDRDRSTVTDFLEDEEMPWTHAFIENGFSSEITDKFEVVGIPKPILVGPDGQIVATGADLRGDALLDTLDEHLDASKKSSDAATSGGRED